MLTNIYEELRLLRERTFDLRDMEILAGAMSLLNEKQALIVAQQKELAELREDRARLDWLQTHCMGMRLDKNAAGFYDVRDDIDRARKGTK